MRDTFVFAVFSSVLLALALVLQACPPAVAPSPDMVDAATLGDASASVYQRACANLASLACPEGVAENCVAVLEHAQTSRLTDLHPACLASAPSKAAARACGSVRCP